jgi:hypothetical protein
MWEPTQIRFSHEIFSYSNVNLNRVANMNLAVALGHYKHAEDKAQE